MVVLLIFFGLPSSKDGVGAGSDVGRDPAVLTDDVSLESPPTISADDSVPANGTDVEAAGAGALQDRSDLLLDADFYGRTTSDVEAVDFGPKLNADEYGYVVRNDEIRDVGRPITVESIEAPGALLRPKNVGELISADRVGYQEEDFQTIDVGPGGLTP